MIIGGKTAPIITFQSVSKIYRTYSSPRHRLLELLSAGRKQYASEKYALDDVSFSLERGARLGIVGENGSGKSTLLKVLSGVLAPTSGQIQVSGRISALLELGAGFNPELTGEENIRQYCLLQGLNRHEIDEALPHIIQFTELRDAIHHPVKTYSSGMAVRLGFSCAVYVKPDILIVDEALSVGDAYFQNKCLHKIKALLDNGITFLYVTHAADAVRSLCQTGIWMDKGRIRMQGSAAEVGAAYQRTVFDRMVGNGLHESVSSTTSSANQAHANRSERHRLLEERVAPLRTGSGELRIIDIELLTVTGEETDTLAFDSNIRVRVLYQIVRPVNIELAMTVGVSDRNGLQIMHFNSASQDLYVEKGAADSLHTMEFAFHLPLCPGEYGINVGIGSFFLNPACKGQLMLESVVDGCFGGVRFKILHPQQGSGKNLWGVVHSPFAVSNNPDIALLPPSPPAALVAGIERDYRIVQGCAPGMAPFDFAIHAGNDECNSRDIDEQGTWEPFATTVFSRLLQPDDVVLDLGANIGWFSVIASKGLGEGGRVFAFEPDPQNHRLLRINTGMADTANRVSVFNMAVSDTEGTLPLYRSESNRGDHRLFADANAREFVEVAVTTLDRFLESSGRLPTVVKSDTQGSESRILRGAQGLFARGWRPLILCEFWPFGLTHSGDDPLALWHTLEGMGYTMYEVAEYNPVLVKASLERMQARLTTDLKPQGWFFTNLLCIPSGSDRLARVADLIEQSA